VISASSEEQRPQRQHHHQQRQRQRRMCALTCTLVRNRKGPALAGQCLRCSSSSSRLNWMLRAGGDMCAHVCFVPCISGGVRAFVFVSCTRRIMCDHAPWAPATRAAYRQVGRGGAPRISSGATHAVAQAPVCSGMPWQQGAAHL